MSPCPLKDQRRINFRLEVLLHDRKYTFGINSALPLTIVSDRIAKRFKTLGQLGVALEDSALGHLTNSDLVLLDNLTLNRSHFFNQPVKAKKIHAQDMTVDFDGELGLDFLLRNHCLIDCAEPALCVRAERPSIDIIDAMAATFRKSHFDEVKMEIRPTPFVIARMKGMPILMQVNTAVNFIALDRGVAGQLGLSLPVEGKIHWRDVKFGDVFITGTDDIGLRAAHDARLLGFSIGERTWDYVFVLVADLNFNAQAPVQHSSVGLLGTDMLINNGTLIDFEGRRLWFMPLSKEQLSTLKWAAEVWQRDVERAKETKK